MASNLDRDTVAGFGFEWQQFDQSALTSPERNELFEQYFHLFPWSELPAGAEGFDLGCGSGRWAKCVAPRVGLLHCIDASGQALSVAMRNLQDLPNCSFYRASADRIPLEPESMDFGYSLGVLHHLPDTAEGLRCCVSRLKPNAPFLLYLYYAFDNRPAWYRLLWSASNAMRKGISRCPVWLRYGVSQAIAGLVYFPLARAARLAKKAGLRIGSFPLAYYRNRSFYTMRTDALDRFGTKLERRFTREQIRQMMLEAGLKDIRFSQGEPFWCALGYKQ